VRVDFCVPLRGGWRAAILGFCLLSVNLHQPREEHKSNFSLAPFLPRRSIPPAENKKRRSQCKLTPRFGEKSRIWKLRRLFLFVRSPSFLYVCEFPAARVEAESFLFVSAPNPSITIHAAVQYTHVKTIKEERKINWIDRNIDDD